MAESNGLRTAVKSGEITKAEALKVVAAWPYVTKSITGWLARRK